MQRTLVLAKPDAVQRGLIGEIIGRFGLERRFYPMRLLVRPSFNVLREDPFSYNLPEIPDPAFPSGGLGAGGRRRAACR